MTLDEAIKHCEEVAEENDYSAVLFRQKKEVSRFLEKAEAENAENECRECAAEHRQLAEWLKELKERRATGAHNVKRGKWTGDEVIQCSNCYFTLNGTTYGRIVHNYFSYCPRCGAKMSDE